MDAAAELGRNPLSTRFSLSMEISKLTRDGTAKPVLRDQIFRRERGQGNINVPCSADHVQDWQPYPVDPYSCYLVYISVWPYIHQTAFLRESLLPVNKRLICRKKVIPYYFAENSLRPV